jgi:hypothetical protein
LLPFIKGPSPPEQPAIADAPTSATAARTAIPIILPNKILTRPL